ncbi:MAG: hypothetical protein NZM43_10115 [Saprospiraceae bacterium]|nr:hypothetical protein [Saprospiraceae bacterium]MDW8484669.1 hypothetical protein [Saprospiraceae bacterium]
MYLNYCFPRISYLPYFLTFGVTVVLCLTLACRTSTSPASDQADLLAFFAPQPAADTLRIEVPNENEPDPGGDSIPEALFFRLLDTALLHEIAHVAEPGAVDRICGLKRFALSANVEGCLVYIRQFWFKHYSLLLYDKRKRAFTGRITLAEWYGGEGGQILTGSWLLDYDGDGDRDIIRRVIQRAIFTSNNHEVQEATNESAEVLLWRDGRFEVLPAPNEAELVKRFPIRPHW